MLQKFWENTIKISTPEASGITEEGPPPGPHAPSRRVLGWGRARGRLDPWWAPWLPPFAYLFLVTGKLRRQKPIFQSRDGEHRQDPSRHLAGGRIDLRELLHHHGRFPDVP